MCGRYTLTEDKGTIDKHFGAKFYIAGFPRLGANLQRAPSQMLPYFHVTITVSEELRDTLRVNQKDGYSLLMKAAAEAITS
jgi:putative SOS response-associated peptidase YedK